MLSYIWYHHNKNVRRHFLLILPFADRLNPYAVDAYDGINLNPLEVVFVKVKGFLLQADWTAPRMSQTYDRWLSHQVFLLLCCLLVIATLTCYVRSAEL